MKKDKKHSLVLPIGYDSFREIREDKSFYYVDKSLFIQDFIEYKNKVALITRPRRFGKTLNMSMVSEFFDIAKDSKDLFEDLAIMDTEYAELINTKPVIYLSFKDCSANDEESLKFMIADTIFIEFERHYESLLTHQNKNSAGFKRYMMLYEMMLKHEVSWDFLSISIQTLEKVLTEHYGIKPIVLIDEYDQPIISSHEYQYHNKVNNFFSSLYGSSLKGQENLSQALLTGIQRVSKESIFSKLNNVVVYTVLNPKYQEYFGLTEDETRKLLNDYDLELTDAVKQLYDGYVFGELSVYNPWSILNYANSRSLENYWINTSTNYLIRKSLLNTDEIFTKQFHQLIEYGEAEVGVKLETSFIELKDNYTLWGLLVNSGYVTIVENMYSNVVKKVRIPNGEVRSEFQVIVAEQARIESSESLILLRRLIPPLS